MGNGDIPTSIDMLGESKFISGFVKREKLAVYDIESGGVLWEYSFEGKGANSQTNKVQVSSKQKMIATANEDHCIRFFDAGTSK